VAQQVAEARTGGRDVDGEVEHVDVLVVGAGISGIGAAYHLTKERPGTRFVVLDALDGFGGTWWTHRYPGVRSDSAFTADSDANPSSANPCRVHIQEKATPMRAAPHM